MAQNTQLWKRTQWKEHQPLPVWLQKVKDELLKRGQECQPVKR